MLDLDEGSEALTVANTRTETYLSFHRGAHEIMFCEGLQAVGVWQMNKG